MPTQIKPVSISLKKAREENLREPEASVSKDSTPAKSGTERKLTRPEARQEANNKASRPDGSKKVTDDVRTVVASKQQAGISKQRTEAKLSNDHQKTNKKASNNSTNNIEETHIRKDDKTKVTQKKTAGKPAKKKKKRKAVQGKNQKISTKDPIGKKKRRKKKPASKAATPRNIQRAVRKAKYYSEMPVTGDITSYYNIKDFTYGMIKTKTGKYVKILEIIPINFFDRPKNKQMSFISQFDDFFRECPARGQFKIVAEKTDTKTYIDHVMAVCPSTLNNPDIIIARDDYVKHIKKLTESAESASTVIYRYFYIYRYEGDADGSFSNDEINIAKQMEMTKRYVVSSLASSENMVVDATDALAVKSMKDLRIENQDFTMTSTYFNIDVLYRLLNRNSAKKETSKMRVERIQRDYFVTNLQKGKPANTKYIKATNYIAPRGLLFRNSKLMMQDGMYYTYAVIRDTGYPDNVPVNWLNNLRQGMGTGIDIDFFYKKLNREQLINNSEKREVWNRVNARSARTVGAQNRYVEKMQSSAYMVKALQAGQDAFDCCTVLTFYGEKPEDVLDTSMSIKRALKSKGFELEMAYDNTEEFYNMTLPLCNFENSIFKRNKRNFLTDTMKTLYSFTTFVLADPTGVVLGRNLDNNSLCSFNNFNTSMFTNGNMLILGTSGAGKSFLEMALGRRQVINGIKVYYILPTKGHEYMDAVQNLGGTYVKLTPSSNDCLNIMELYPEVDKFDAHLAGDDAEGASASVLVKKITSLVAWLRMLTIAEDDPTKRLTIMDTNRMNSLLNNLYNDFGFTNDNNSILDPVTGQKKRMPLLSDWKKYIEEDPVLAKYADLLTPFTNGTFKNFDRPTNIDITKKMVVFNVEVNEIGEDLQPAIMFIAFDAVNGMIRGLPAGQLGVCYLDEVWKLMQDDSCAKQVYSMVKLIRGYGGAAILASQDIEEFARNDFGKAVLSNTQIRIILKLQENEFEAVQQYLKLSSEDYRDIARFSQGDGLFMCNNSKVHFHLDVTNDELVLYDTDPNRRKENQKYLADIARRKKEYKEKYAQKQEGGLYAQI